MKTRFTKIICVAMAMSAILLSSCAKGGDTKNNTISDEEIEEIVPTATDEAIVKTDSENILELKNTYTTQYGTVNAVTCPQFEFDYSDNWTITTNEVDKGGQNTAINEELILTNGNGATIHYIDFNKLGGYGKSIAQYEVTKVADSQFTAGYIECETGVKDLADEWGNFMVGEIKVVGEYDYKTGELIPLDGGVYYAVMPNSYVGTHEATGLAGFYEEFVTEYGNYLLYAESPDGNFTEEDKQEVIQILSTFR